jgi:GH25 family lysozyme M1 (1,4-beta-N-acetylmuramidase)
VTPTNGWIRGIDVSHHDGSIDWGGVASSGIRFAYIKSSEGTGFVDPRYAANRTAAARLGLRVGAFHFARPDLTPEEASAEADHFIATADFRAGDLAPMLDLEVTDGLSVGQLDDWVSTFLARVVARTGIHPGIYVSPDFWRAYLGDTSTFGSSLVAPLWIAHWTAGGSPSVPGSNWGGRGWTVWQFTDHGSVSGISHSVDLDRMTGAQLARLTIR